MLVVWVKLDYKNMQFGEMKKKRPVHGPRKGWRDLVSNDLKFSVLMDSMNCVRVGTVGIRDVRRGSSNYHLYH